MNWQKRARIGVALFGLASAIAVYAAMGERVRPAPATPPVRVDPKAVIESQGNVLQQVRGTKQDYVVEAAQQLVYEGGATSLRDVKVTVNNRAGGRDFVITAREAQAGEKQQELQLAGTVVLKASDGFELSTSKASFKESDGRVLAPEAFSFSRDHMEGVGTGMTYARDTDVLSIARDADVRLRDEGGNTVTQFTSGAAVFTRPEHRLELTGTVHVLHNGQVIDAASATAFLTDDDSFVRSILLRGQSQVAGGGSGLESMRAEDIDLTYAEDGVTLDHVVLRGAGQVTTAASEGASGRSISGNLLDILLAPDGQIARVTGRDGVRLDLGAGADAPARHVTAQSLDGTGESGQGLTAAQFRDRVEYREAGRSAGQERVARARSLRVLLAGDAVESALFTGAVTFSDREMQASGGEGAYAPAQGTLRLTRGTERAAPRMTDTQISVEGDAIDVALDTRAITARGDVQTTLRSAQRTGTGASASASDTKLPGLLKQEQPVNVAAASFSYTGTAGSATYTGDATLLQGDTAIRADEITIDQTKGDLAAVGNARSTFALDTGTFIGNGGSITYADSARTVTYVATPPQPPAAAVPARLSAPQGDLRAERIQILLAAEGGKADRIEAYTAVDLNVDKRRASGARLTYFAADDRYLLTGTAAAPVTLTDNCRQTSGRTLIFFKSADRMTVDGNEEIRTQTTNGGPCSAAPPRSR